MSEMLDKKDKLILEELKKNARNSTLNIASATAIPRVTVHDRINKMIKNNIVRSFTAVPNYQKLGLNTTVYIFVSTNPCEHNVSVLTIAKKISSFSNVFETHIVSGEYDILIKTRGESFDEIGTNIIAKIREINGVGKTLTIPCFSTLKETI